MKNKRELDKDTFRIIKISGNALIEFIYEKFLDDQREYFDLDPETVVDHIYVDLESGSFICCAEHAGEPKDGMKRLPEEIDIRKVMRNIDDTTLTMFAEKRYKDFTREELIELSEKSE